MIKIKVLLARIGSKFRRKLPIILNIVEAIKSFIDSPVDDIVGGIIAQVIPGSVDDLIIQKIKSTLHEYLPKVLLNLHILQEIDKLTDPEEKARVIAEELTRAIGDLKYCTDEQKQIFFHGLASLLIEKLSDGKLTWSEALSLSEYGYQYFIKKK